jgi:glycosyltransferase involved in cell wall biosynthesis
MARQIAACYQREARIIYAPIRLADYHVGESDGEYYLVVSRLMSHKRVDLAVLACQKLGRKLLIVGDGPERARLQALANDDVLFLGRVSDTRLKDLYANCRAVIFASEEDYGLVPLEAQASGRPVIAYGSGGALETIIESQTGIFFRQQTVDSVTDAILEFERMRFDPMAIRQAVRRFDVEHFGRELREFVLEP